MQIIAQHWSDFPDARSNTLLGSINLYLTFTLACSKGIKCLPISSIFNLAGCMAANRQVKRMIGCFVCLCASLLLGEGRSANVVCFRQMANFIINGTWYSERKESVEEEAQRIVETAAKIIWSDMKRHCVWHGVLSSGRRNKE